jgi:hypothetical protein
MATISDNAFAAAAKQISERLVSTHPTTQQHELGNLHSPHPTANLWVFGRKHVTTLVIQLSPRSHKYTRLTSLVQPCMCCWSMSACNTNRVAYICSPSMNCAEVVTHGLSGIPCCKGHMHPARRWPTCARVLSAMCGRMTRSCWRWPGTCSCPPPSHPTGPRLSTRRQKHGNTEANAPTKHSPSIHQPAAVHIYLHARHATLLLVGGMIQLSRLALLKHSQHAPCHK